jgi:hypothetical protein
MRTLSASEVTALATIVTMAHKGQHVARLVNDDVVQGTARSIGDRNGNFAGPDDDIRDQLYG